MNVLVVEDDKEMAELLVRGLREEAHEVNLARDGSAALALSNNSTFDVILLDIMLPGMDGLEVAKHLRLRREQVPVLMLTARDALSDVVKGLGHEIFARYASPRGEPPATDLPPQVGEMVDKQAIKRVALEFVELRRASWDHRKLGGTY